MATDDAPILPQWPLQSSLTLSSPAATDALAQSLSGRLKPGDVLLLSGHLGSGKSHFARALIRARLQTPELPVPRPTFTLVQTYAALDGAEIWHADLYRLGDPGELIELGLDDALETAICLIEWPDRMAPDWPDATILNFTVTGDDTRQMDVFAPASSTLAARLFSGISA